MSEALATENDASSAVAVIIANGRRAMVSLASVDQALSLIHI